MRYLIFILIISSLNLCFSQSHIDEVDKFQKDLNNEFLDPETSPLDESKIKNFKGHDFFEINQDYCIKAEFIKSIDIVTFQMKTSTSRLPTYDKFGIAKFNLNGKQYQLTLYQSHRLRESEKYKNYLFLPYTDLTNGFESYGGGRYIDLTIPDGNEIIIDFNKSYAPSCAYNHSYSCPVPPEENHLNVRIEAGVKNLK